MLRAVKLRAKSLIGAGDPAIGVNRRRAEGDSFHPNPAANLVGDRKSFWLFQPRGSFVVYGTRTLRNHLRWQSACVSWLVPRPGGAVPISQPESLNARRIGESAVLLNAPPVRTTPHRPFPPRAGVGLSAVS